MYMAVVSIAIIISFHLKSQPTPLELRMAKPLGVIFWILSFCCLAVGFSNYVRTITQYSRRVAIVQTGWKTQSVGLIFLLVKKRRMGICVALDANFWRGRY